MKVKVCDSVANLHSRIIEYYSDSELRKFANLTLNRKVEIWTETLERRFKYFWNLESRNSVFKKKSKKTDDDSENIKPITKTINIKTRKSHPEFSANLIFDFDATKKLFIVEITNEYSACGDDVTQTYTRILEEEILDIKRQMEEKYSDEMFLRDFFATLHAHNLSTVRGIEAIVMHVIYRNAIRHYPMFKNLSYGDRLDIMAKAFSNGHTRAHNVRDIYGYAKVTFETLCMYGLIDVIYLYDRTINQYKIYSKTYERRITRRNPERPAEVWEYDYLVYAMYEYTTNTGVMLRTCFHPADLWLLLTGRGTEVYIR